jgi:hypothetical protein
MPPLKPQLHFSFSIDPQTYNHLLDLLAHESQEQMRPAKRSPVIQSLINRRWSELFNGHKPAAASVPCEEEKNAD